MNISLAYSQFKLKYNSIFRFIGLAFLTTLYFILTVYFLNGVSLAFDGSTPVDFKKTDSITTDGLLMKYYGEVLLANSNWIITDAIQDIWLL